LCLTPLSAIFQLHVYHWRILYYAISILAFKVIMILLAVIQPD